MISNTIKENLNTPNPNVGVSKSWQDVFNDLNDNPIFRMSLGSKELFHSNFLAFLWDLDRDSFISMINDKLLENEALSLDDRSKYELSRETKNFDILISHKDKDGNRVVYDLVIENKVKSVPYLSQLNDYVEKVHNNNKNEKCSFLLLSLSQMFPDYDLIDKNQGGKWNVISYSSLKTAIENSYMGDYGRSNQYIGDYLSFIDKLSQLQQMIIPEGVDKSVLFVEKDINDFKSLRLQDLYIKLRSSYFIVNLYNRLKQDLPVSFIHSYDWGAFKKKKDNTHIFLNLGYNQGNGQIAAWIYSQKESQTRTYEIVIQGKQYRHGIGQKQDKASNNTAKGKMLNGLWNTLKNVDSDLKFLSFLNLESVSELSSVVRPIEGKDYYFRFKTEDGKQIVKSGPFDCYGDSYVYRYVDISNIKMGVLLDTMVKDIHSVFNYLNNNEKPL